MQRTTLAYVVYGSLLFSIPVTVAYLLVVGRLFGRLKRDHPIAYREVGEPSLLNNSILSTLRTITFLVPGKYKNLHDPRVNSLAVAASAFFIAAILLYLLSMVLVTSYWSSLGQ